MKRIFWIIALFVGLSVSGQTRVINAKIKAKQVDEVAAADSIIVRGSDEILKYISRSNLLSGYATENWVNTNFAQLSGDNVAFTNVDNNFSVKQTFGNIDMSGTLDMKGASSSYIRDYQDELLVGSDSGSYYFARGFAQNVAKSIQIGTGFNTYTAIYGQEIRLENDTKLTGTLDVSSSLVVGGVLATKDKLRVLNKLETGYLDWALRDTTGTDAVYNLQNIGTASFKGLVTANANIDLPPTSYINFNTGDDTEVLRFSRGGGYSSLLVSGSYGQGLTLNLDANNNSNFEQFHIDFTGNRKLSLTTSGLVLTDLLTANGGISMPDNQNLSIGTHGDLKLYHNGANGYIHNNTGDFYIRTLADNKAIRLQSDDGLGGLADYVWIDGNVGSVSLFNYGVKKLETTSTGVTLAGQTFLDGTNDLTLKPDFGANDSQILASKGLELTAGLGFGVKLVSDAGTVFEINSTGTSTAKYDLQVDQDLNVDGKITGAVANIPLGTTETGTGLTVNDAMAGTIIPFTNNNNITVTINTTSLQNVGDLMYLDQNGTATLTVSAGTGVTLQVLEGYQATCSKQYGRLIVQKVAAATYKVYGDIDLAM